MTSLTLVALLEHLSAVLQTPSTTEKYPKAATKPNFEIPLQIYNI